ncbi:hypothetical protein ACOMHN_022393 [Nucella lapillus]
MAYEENRDSRRHRKRLSVLLHTHVVLIVVCTLSALDAACVMGQIICDVLIMKGTCTPSVCLVWGIV